MVWLLHSRVDFGLLLKILDQADNATAYFARAMPILTTESVLANAFVYFNPSFENVNNCWIVKTTF